MKLKHLISLVLLIALIGTVSATTQEYGNWTDFWVNSTTTQTDYQVKMILDNRTGSSSTTLFYTNGTTRSDWMDIKWTDTSNATLGFWKENRTDTTTNSTWWIKVPSIANDNTTKIRLFYGNASKTTSYADGFNTFAFFDDFPESSVNATKWATITGTHPVSDSVVTISSTKITIPVGIRGNTSYDQGYAFRSRTNPGTTPTGIGIGYAGAGLTLRVFGTGSDAESIFFYRDPTQSLTGQHHLSTEETHPIPLYNTYNIFEMQRVSTSRINFMVNDSLAVSTTTNVATGGLYPVHMINGNTVNAYTYLVDWSVVRKYTATEPFLTVTPLAPVASFTVNKILVRIPQSITCTDTSTNTPTSWQWSWGDGTANSTTQNPSHQYLKRGKFDIYLTATNAGGSGSTGATAVRVTGYENYY